jgi:hypothetical protein
MKALPEAVQRAFPREAHDLPERPWWYTSRLGLDGVDLYRRSHDTRIFAFTVKEVAAHDAAHPLPHPGYRAGQVWAREDGSSVVVSRALLHENSVLLDIAGSGWKHTDFDRVWPYLMADLACPHLAPWSPAEVKTP